MGGALRARVFLADEFVSVAVQRCPRPRQILKRRAGCNEVAQQGSQMRRVVDIKADDVAIGVQINFEAVRCRAGLSARPGGYLNVKAISFVVIATLDVCCRKPFHDGPRQVQWQAALCEQTDDVDRARNRAGGEREFSHVRHVHLTALIEALEEHEAEDDLADPAARCLPLLLRQLRQVIELNRARSSSRVSFLRAELGKQMRPIPSDNGSYFVVDYIDVIECLNLAADPFQVLQTER